MRRQAEEGGKGRGGGKGDGDEKEEKKKKKKETGDEVAVLDPKRDEKMFDREAVVRRGDRGGSQSCFTARSRMT